MYTNSYIPLQSFELYTDLYNIYTSTNIYDCIQTNKMYTNKFYVYNICNHLQKRLQLHTNI